MYNSSTMMMVAIFLLGYHSVDIGPNGPVIPLLQDDQGRATIQEPEPIDILLQKENEAHQRAVRFFWFGTFGCVAALGFLTMLLALVSQYSDEEQMIAYHPILGRVYHFHAEGKVAQIGLLPIRLILLLVWLVCLPCVVLAFLLWTWKTKRPWRAFTFFWNPLD